MIVFSHIEKCAGTSLTNYFRGNYPFESCDIVAKGNKACESDFEVAKKFYPNCKFLAGHSLTPDTFSKIKCVFGEVTTFSVLREPVERTISNFVYDRARGVWGGSLIEYANIDWKINYLLRFLGGGNVENGLEGFQKLDFVFTVDEISRYMPHVLSCASLYTNYSNRKVNTADADWGGLPQCVSVVDGCKVGRYTISENEYKEIAELNAEDIVFYRNFKKMRSSLVSDHIASDGVMQRQALFKRQLASVYRNMLYKPCGMRVFGRHGLGRNLSNPICVSAHDAF